MSDTIRCSGPDDRLLFARVIVELGELYDAEAKVVEMLEERPDDLTALSLFAKIKHMRGELSAAVACWAQIHARSPHNERALMQLGALLHLTRDPERGAGEFMSLGQLELARKPAAQLAIEEALRLYLDRRPDEARERCRALGAKYNGKDPEIYKLAVLGNAWIAELSGELEAAVAILERFGKERGFEADTDRLLALVRVYERLGGTDKLQAAVNICLHLDGRFEKISLYSRLAGLYRRLDQGELAKEYEQRYLEAFRGRMHRPTFAEIVRAAAHQYIPLTKLVGLRCRTTDATLEPSTRERAIAAVLSGDLDRGRRLFTDGGEHMDQKYLGDLLVLDGKSAEAAVVYLAALEHDPTDLRLLGWLCDYYAVATTKDAAAAAIAAHLRVAAVAARARQAFEDAIQRSPLRPSLWRQLGSLNQILGGDDQASHCHKRAQALAEAAGLQQNPVGRVLAAAVYNFIGKSKGLVHEIWAERRAVPRKQGGWLLSENVLGNLTAEMKEGVRNTFLAVREYARAKLPHLTADILEYDYGYKVTKEDEPSSGLSAGLPTALAFLSLFLQRPVSQDIASSGVVVADAHDVLTVRTVGDPEYKVKAAYHRNLQMLILPLENRAALSANSQVPAAICEEIVRYVSTFDQAVCLVFGDDIFYAAP